MKLKFPVPLVFLAGIFLLHSCYTLRGSNGGGQHVQFSGNRQVNPAHIALPPGYQIEAIATGLNFPSAVAIDETGTVYALEAGYALGGISSTPKLLRIGPEGKVSTIATGTRNGPWNGLVYHNGSFFVAEGGQTMGGRILRIEKDGATAVLTENLPSLGDYHTNGPAIGPDGMLYFGQGAATNAGVAGPDNFDFGWLKRNPEFHDIPCKDISLAGENFVSENPLDSTSNKTTTTGAFVAFGTATAKNQVINGSIPCTGAVMRIPLSGGSPELVAWGLRNPFGLAFAPDGNLFVTENSFEVRGNRPVWGTSDLLWQVMPGKWYGFPDFWAGIPVNSSGFSQPGHEANNFLLLNHPGEIPKPAAKLGVQSSSKGLDFSTNPAFGYQGQAFVAQFGDLAPISGKVLGPVGFKIVRVDVNTGVVTQFAANKGNANGPASLLGSGGLERPMAVRFSPDGKALYIADYGVLTLSDAGPSPKQNTGVIWKITKK